MHGHARASKWTVATTENTHTAPATPLRRRKALPVHHVTCYYQAEHKQAGCDDERAYAATPLAAAQRRRIVVDGVERVVDAVATRNAELDDAAAEHGTAVHHQPAVP